MTLGAIIAWGIVVVVLVVGVVFIVKQLARKQKEEAVSSILLTVGIDLIVTSFGTFDDKIFALLTNHEIENNIVQLVTGGILVAAGLLLVFHTKHKLYILNINGMFQDRRIDHHHKDVGLTPFQFKEKEIDFVRLYKNGINQVSAHDVIEEIEHKVFAFKMESKDKKRGYTGIASIPFTMMAGKFFEREKIDEFFEYDKKKQAYYELKSKERYPKLKLQVKDPFTDLTIKNCDELVVAISITAQIQDHQLSQFCCPHIHLTVPKPEDNRIQSKTQLQDYVNTAYTILDDAGTKCPKLKTIHLVISSQSCFVFELGKLIDDNRMKKIICYHYQAQSTPNYPWGICINGTDKGKWIS